MVKSWIKRHKILTAFLGLFTLLWTVFYVMQVDWYKSLIPSKLQPGWPIAIDGETYLFSGCGSASFTLPDEVAEAIESQGLAFFEDAKEAQPRFLFRKETRKKYYPEWVETQTTNPKLADGGYADFVGCDSSFSQSKKQAIYEAIKQSGSYRTNYSESGVITVIPELRMIMFVYSE